MTRGRPPVKAVKEAIEMAKTRGLVWEVPENAGLPFDFVIFLEFCIWFIKVLRTRSNPSAVRVILQLCRAVIPVSFLGTLENLYWDWINF